MPAKRFVNGRRLGLRGYLGFLFAASSLIVGGTLLGIGHLLISRILESDIKDRINIINRYAKSNITSEVRRQARPFLAQFSHGLIQKTKKPEDRIVFLPLLQVSLLNNPLLESMFVGFENGDFFFVTLPNKHDQYRLFKGPPDTAMVVREVRGSLKPSTAEYFFYDSELRLLAQRPDEMNRGYDPRVRKWYKEAMRASGQIETGPMLLPRTDNIGTVFAQKNSDGNSVTGIAVRLDQLAESLENELPTPGSHLALFRPDGTLIAGAKGMIPGETGTGITGSKGAIAETNNVRRIYQSSDLEPIIRRGVEKYRQGVRTAGLPIKEGGKDWLLILSEVDTSDQENDFMVLAIPRNEMFSEAEVFLHYTILGLTGIMMLAVPLIWSAIQYVVHPLRVMAEQTQNLYEIDFNGENGVRSHVAEVDALAQGVGNLQEYLKKILDILGSIGSEGDFSRLIGRVLQETVTMAGADGGGVLLINEKEEIEDIGYYYWKGGKIKTASTAIAEYNDELSQAVSRALIENNAVKGSVSRENPRAGYEALAPGFAIPGITRIEEIFNALRSRTGEPLGVLVLFKAAASEEAVFSSRQVTFIETLAAAASIVLETQHLIKGQNDLRDALIHILAGAIDAKSPYTGGHCARVPVIFQMLLEAANAAKEGPLKDFTLDEDGWEEARLAAWLHDCGKVTTPEYVMDKATKLETLYDRIHEIRTRFEVLKRDAEIAYLRAVLNGADALDERWKLEEMLHTLDEDFAFVASCNIGGENMNTDDLERLTAIGQRTWTRTIDKRLGVSRDEKSRMDSAGTPDPPVCEYLLMDNPEHIIPRNEQDVIPADNPLGFKLTTPHALYNRGELYNLSIRRGTLTEEERYKINDHITQTIMMLNAMPLPKHLRNVPEIAGAHHETMDGRGYPRGLKREEMSWEARMMAIADIFEALTARDRPYKSSKTLREALKIMDRFKERNHIDPDLYNLFLKANIPQRYAADCLKPEQNDL